MSSKTSDFLHYFFNITAYTIGYPFMIAVGFFPFLLLSMAFTGKESVLDIIVFYGVIILFSIALILLLSALRVAKKDFYRRRGVISWKEYYSLYLSKGAKARKLQLQEHKKAKANSQSEFLDALTKDKALSPNRKSGKTFLKCDMQEYQSLYLSKSAKSTTSEVQARNSKTSSIGNTSNLTAIAHLMALPTKLSDKQSDLANLKLFISASFYSFLVVITLTCSFLLLFNQPLSFFWALLFFQGMFLSFFSSSRSIGIPFKTPQKSQPHLIKRLLFGKRAKDVDFKIFLLYLGIILVVLSLLLFAFQELTNH